MISLAIELPSGQISSSPDWSNTSSSLLSSITSLAVQKVGWVVEDKSLAHILSVITTLCCLSVILCKISKKNQNNKMKMQPISLNKITNKPNFYRTLSVLILSSSFNNLILQHMLTKLI